MAREQKSRWEPDRKALATGTAPLHARPGHGSLARGAGHAPCSVLGPPSWGRAHLVVHLNVEYLARDSAARTVAFVR